MRHSFKKGYSLIELTVSLLVFLVAASVISLAVAQSLSASAQSKTERAALSALESLSKTLGSAPFLALASDSFIPPDRCVSDIDLVGSAAKSCILIEGRDYEVIWSVDTGGNLEGNASVLNYLDITATINLLNSNSVSYTYQVKAPSDAWREGFGAVRVSFIGPFAELAGPVYLISGNLGSVNVIDSEIVSESGVVVLTAPVGSCTVISPCRVSIASNGVLGRSGDVGMRTSSLFGSESSIILGDSVWMGLSVNLFKVGSAAIDVLAVNDGGVTYRNTEAGSICIWGTFLDDQGKRSVPLCNNSDGYIMLDKFAPDVSYPNSLVPLPTGVKIELSIDHPSGKCVAADGMKGSTATGWVTAAVCSSWSWGVPSSFTRNGQVAAFDDAYIILESGVISKATLSFSGDKARPAAGFGATAEGWSRPRQAAGCAFDGSCSSMKGFIPEIVECPNDHCLSAVNAAPRVTSPSNGSLGVHTVVISGTSTVFSPSFQDADGDLFMVTLLSLPSKGTLQINGNSGAVGSVVSSNGGSYIYSPDDSYDGNDSFKVRLNDGKSNGSRDVEIGLVDSLSRPWILIPTVESIGQSSTGVASAKVYNAGGGIAASAPVTFFSSTPGIVVNSLVATGLDGVAESSVTVSNIARGSYPIVIESAGRSLNSSVLVTPKPGSISAVITGVSQGGRGVMDIDVYDKIGSVISGESVSFAVYKNGTLSYNVYPEYAGCVLGVSGCTVDLVADAKAVEGEYTLRSSIGGLINNTTFSVAPSTSKVILIGNGKVSQGGESLISVRAIDPAGTGVDGASISIVKPSRFQDRVVLSNSSGTTNSEGAFEFSVAAPLNSTAGEITLLATVGGKSWPVNIIVESVANSIIYSAPNLSILQGGVGTTWVSVIDKAGDVMKGAAVTFTSATSSGLRINSAAVTGVDGRATFSVSVNGNSKAELKSLTATTAGLSVSFSVLVLPAATSVSVISAASAPSGNFKVVLLDGFGDPMKNAPVLISSVTGGSVALRSNSTSNLDGSVLVDITDGVKGEYRFMISSGGKSVYGWYRVA